LWRWRRGSRCRFRGVVGLVSKSNNRDWVCWFWISWKREKGNEQQLWSVFGTRCCKARFVLFGDESSTVVVFVILFRSCFYSIEKGSVESLALVNIMLHTQTHYQRHMCARHLSVSYQNSSSWVTYNKGNIILRRSMQTEEKMIPTFWSAPQRRWYIPAWPINRGVKPQTIPSKQQPSPSNPMPRVGHLCQAAGLAFQAPLGILNTTAEPILRTMVCHWVKFRESSFCSFIRRIGFVTQICFEKEKKRPDVNGTRPWKARVKSARFQKNQIEKPLQVERPKHTRNYKVLAQRKPRRRKGEI